MKPLKYPYCLEENPLKALYCVKCARPVTEEAAVKLEKASDALTEELTIQERYWQSWMLSRACR